jgi:SepF-like predicted cell division protein (DUF552 family)
MGLWDKVKDKLGMKDEESEAEEGYVELDTETETPKSKVIVRPFVLHDFENIKEILESKREGHTIALVNMKPLKNKDITELKRAISKLKKTTDAVEGEIAGFGEDYIVVTPSFATIYKSKSAKTVNVDQSQVLGAGSARDDKDEI